MNFSFLNKKNDSKEKLYLGLLLKQQEATALVIKDEGKKFQVIDKEKFNYSNGWDSLTEDTDKTVFQLEQKLNTSFKEIIFFVYSHFVDEKTKEIKQEHLSKIKSLTRNLEFKPLGYIECYEAIANFFEKKEELPLTAIIVELDNTKLSIFIYKGGVVSFSKTVDRTNNIIKDFTGAIEEIKGKMLLPSKIILYDSKNLDEEISKILTHQWSEEFFIQLPRVHVVKEHEILDSLVRVFEGQIKSGMPADTNESAKKEEIKNEEILGFAIGKDVETTEEVSHGFEEKPKISKPKIRLGHIFAKISGVFKKIHFKLPIADKKVQGARLIIAGLLLIAVAIFLNEFFFHKASLTLYLPSQKMTETMVIKDSEIPIEASTISAELAEDKATTGKKEIGEKAKGSVTIHNFSSSPKNFKAGVLVDSNGIKFALDQDINVASAENTIVGSSLVKQPGKAKVPVTAADIGPQYNLEKNHQFTLEEYSADTFIALNEEAMAGGTKKEVRTVSKKDIDDLKVILLEKGEKENVNKNKVNNRFTIINDLTETNIENAVFSGELGEEADSVSLKATIESIFYYLDNTKLFKFLSGKLEWKLLAGFVLDKSRMNFKIIKVERTDEGTDIEVKVTAYAIKDVSDDKIIGNVVGKRQGDLDKILKNNYEIKGFKIEMKEPLPLINQWMPLFKKNIDLKISIL